MVNIIIDKESPQSGTVADMWLSPGYPIPQVGEEINYNGLTFKVKRIIHCYSDTLTPLVRLIVND